MFKSLTKTVFNVDVSDNRSHHRSYDFRGKTASLAISALTIFVIHSFGVNTLNAEETARPNVILMMADDMGWGDPQCFNSDSPILTPHLDAMAANGLKFNRFYAAAPVCSPTRGSCLTGRHPFRYGIYFANTGHMLPPEVTLPELLQKRGYRTGHFGKWHLGTLTKTVKDANRGGPRGVKHYSIPTENGYDTCLVTESKVPTYDPLIKPTKNASSTGWDYIRDRSKAVDYGTHYWNEKGESVTGLTGDDSQVMMDAAVPFIKESVVEKKPFFAVIWFHAPHLPVVAGPEHVKPYQKYSEYERNYYGCITALDEQVGRVRAVLREQGIEENTLVCFCSDNGPEGQAKSAPGSAGPFRGRKRSLYEGGVRVPGIIEWPGHIKSGETEFPAVTSDYLPTIVDMLDLELPDRRPLDGISLLPLFNGKMTEREKPIFFRSKKMLTHVAQRYKLVTLNDGKTWELYDLIDDPVEANDISAQHPDRVKMMSKQLEAWRESCKQSDRGKDYLETK